MKNLLGFIGNFTLSMIFSFDLLNYYFQEGINIINNDINRVGLSWFGLVVCVLSSNYFITQKFKKHENNL